MRKLLAFVLLLFLSPSLRAQISGAGNIGCSGTAVTGTAITSATANNTVVASITNFSAWGALVQLDQGTTITAGAVTFNLSGDGGANYTAVPVAQVLNPSTFVQLTNPYTLVASTNQGFLIILNGNSNFQVKLTTAMTGTGTITPYVTAICTQPQGLQFDANGNAKININAQGLGKVLVTPDSVALPANQSVNENQIAGSTVSTAASGVQKVGVVGNAGATLDGAPGSAAPTNVLAEGLFDGTNSQRALADTNGRQLVKQYPDTTSIRYRASKKFAASSTTDNFVLPGNATTTAAIMTKLTLTCTQTTAGVVNVEVIKRSAADTGGTSATFTIPPTDSAFAAANSAPLSYTGTGPSVGSSVGDLDNAQIGCNASGTAGPNDIYIYPGAPVVLRGTAQEVAINLGGAVTGGTITVTVEWIETNTP